VAYIGTAPTAGQYRKLDSISSSFNGSTTTFTMQVGGQNVSAGTPAQLLISLGGVIQQPTTDYTVSTSSLTFVTAPASGLSFFAILMGDALSVGTPADGTVSTAKLVDAAVTTAKLADAGVTTAKLASGLTVDLTSGSAAAPSLTFDANTGLYSPAEDEIGFVEGGVEAARIDSSGRLLVGTSSVVATAFGTSNGQFVCATTDVRPLIFGVYNNSAFGARYDFIKSRGTSVNSQTIVNGGDELGALYFIGTDGGGPVPAASIRSFVDGTPGSNDMPGALVFSTTADGASSPTERLRIANNGQLSAVVPGASTLFPGFLARAWVNFNGTGVVAIRASGNVSSITDNGVGDYTINFTTAMTDANYAATGMGMNESNSQVIVRSTIAATASALRIIAQLPNVDVGDPTVVSVAVFR